MIIGAQKAGTSSLNRYLAKHPDFITHEDLEFTYFINDKEYAEGYQKAYLRHFPHWSSGDSIIAKSVGIMYLEESLIRLKTHNPDVKLVVVLRHPVERAYSAYWYARRLGWETIPTFEEAMEADENRFGDNWIARRFCEYYTRSEYVTHLEILYRHFRKDQVYVLLNEDLAKRTEEVCNDLMYHFGFSKEVALDKGKKYNRSALPKYAFVTDFLTDRNPLKKYFKKLMPTHLGRKMKNKLLDMNEKEFKPPKIDAAIRAALSERFRSANERLATLIGRDLSHWNK